MVWTDPGSLSNASVARTHGGGNTPRPATTLGITERSVVGIVTGLITAGDAVNDKQAAGRGHRIHGNARRPLVPLCRGQAGADRLIPGKMAT